MPLTMYKKLDTFRQDLKSSIHSSMSAKTRFSQKKLKKYTIRTIRRIERVFKKDDFINIATYLRISLKIEVIYLDLGT